MRYLEDSTFIYSLLSHILNKLKSGEYFTAEVISDLVRKIPKGRLAKFQPYLPPAQEERYIEEKLLDIQGAVTISCEKVSAVKEFEK